MSLGVLQIHCIVSTALASFPLYERAECVIERDGASLLRLHGEH